MKYFKTLGIQFLALLGLLSITLTSCKNDDEDDNGVPQYPFSQTNYYGSKVDSTVVRTDAVGKWYDSNDKLVLNIEQGYKNPEFPFIIKDGVKQPKPYYSYDFTSDVDGYPFSKIQKADEIARHGNNINIGGMFNLIVEGNNGYLWVQRNQPILIKVSKK